MTINFNWKNDHGNTTPVAATSLTATAGGTITSGDFLLVVCNVLGAASVDPGAITAPDGTWTQIDNFFNLNGVIRSSIFWKIAGVSEPTTPIFSWTNSNGWNYAFLNYTGVANSGSIDASGVTHQTGFSTSIVAPSVSPTGSTGLAIAIGCNEGGKNPYTNFTGMTSRVSTGSTSSGNPEMLVADLQLSASGATGTFTATMTNNDPSNSATIVLVPSAGTLSFVPRNPWLQAAPILAS